MNFQDQQLIALLGALQGAGSLDASNQVLGQEQQNAQANRAQAGGAHSYGALAGLGNGLAQVFGSIHQGQIEKQQQANAVKQGDYNSQVLQAIQKMLQGEQSAPGAQAGGNVNPTMPVGI